MGIYIPKSKTGIFVYNHSLGSGVWPMWKINQFLSWFRYGFSANFCHHKNTKWIYGPTVKARLCTWCGEIVERSKKE